MNLSLINDDDCLSIGKSHNLIFKQNLSMKSKKSQRSDAQYRVKRRVCCVNVSVLCHYGNITNHKSHSLFPLCRLIITRSAELARYPLMYIISILLNDCCYPFRFCLLIT